METQWSLVNIDTHTFCCQTTVYFSITTGRQSVEHCISMKYSCNVLYKRYLFDFVIFFMQIVATCFIETEVGAKPIHEDITKN